MKQMRDLHDTAPSTRDYSAIRERAGVMRRIWRSQGRRLTATELEALIGNLHARGIVGAAALNHRRKLAERIVVEIGLAGKDL